MTLLMIIRVAFRALVRNKMRAALTMLGIIIGVSAVIAMVSIGQGASASVQAQIESIGTNLLFVSAGAQNVGGVRSGTGDTGTQTLTVDDLDAIKREVPSVSMVTPSVNARSQLVAGNFAGQVGQGAVEGVVSQAFVVAHENVLKVMSAPTGNEPPTPFGAWPTETFFQDEKTMYFNGEGIELAHVKNASTDGDILVFFRSSDVIAAGDIYNTLGYPRIDVARGGSVNGVIEGLNRLIDIAISEQFTEGGTRIVPGHGRISDEFDVVEYRDMVTIVRDRVAAMIKKGRTLAQVQAARPTIDWEPRYGSSSGPWTTAMFVEAVYRSLSSAGK